jgi:hypothetical protein
MLKRSAWTKAGVALVSILFLAGVVRLFALRFSKGDVHTPYSSLRADPLGARALYEAYDEIPGVDCRRLLRSLDTLRDSRNYTLYALGISASALFNRETSAELRSAALGGARIVLALTSRTVERDEYAAEDDKPENKDENEPDRSREGRDDKDADRFSFPAFQLNAGELGFEIQKLDDVDANATSTIDGVEARVPWHGGTRFTALKSGWTPIYNVDGKPVVIERRFRQGSIVVMTDSYLLSNEALRFTSTPKFLLWLTGTNRTILFDETHHGAVEQLGVMHLVKKYNLVPALAAAAMLALLFIWRNATTLIPAQKESVSAVVSGRDAAVGRINLLRRSVPPQTVTATCVEFWDQALGHLSSRSQYANAIQSVAESESSLPPRKRNPVAAYNQIANMLKQRRRI